MTQWWPAVLILAALYCLAQAIRDFRAKNYVMAAAGALCVALLVLVPIQAGAVKLDLPAAR